jgi:general secretion pathway protein A
MYDQFFNFFGLREDPFHVSPDPRFYQPTRTQESALAELLFGVETRQGFMVLTGEAGTGKTTLLNQLLDYLHRRHRSTALIFHARLEPAELLQFILRDFGVHCLSHVKGDMIDALYNWLLTRHSAGDLPVLIIDEAQALPAQTLDELRLLLNLETPRGKLLQIILSGQPELDEKLRLPALRQLRQRIMFHSRISLLAPEEIGTYISFRLSAAGSTDVSFFPEDAVQAIYAASHGIPRVINLLSEHALISAYAEQKRAISPEMIERIATDFDLLAQPLAVSDTPVPSRPRGRYAAYFPNLDSPLRPPVAPSPVPTPPSPVSVAAAARPAPLRTPEPEAAPAPTPAHAVAADGSSEEVRDFSRQWHRHRSHPNFAVFVRKAVGFLQRAWLTLSTSAVVSWRSLFAPKVLVPDVHLEAPTYVHQDDSVDPVPIAPPLPTMSIPRVDHPVAILRPPRPVAVVTPRPAPASRSVRHPLVHYFRSVYRSLAHDCHLFFRALTLTSPALELDSSPASRSVSSAIEKSHIRRNVLVPVAKWLRQPISPGPFSGPRRPERSASRK